MNQILTIIAKAIAVPLVGILSIAGYNFNQTIPVQTPIVNQTTFGNYNPSGGGTYRLQNSVGLSNTSINLSSFKEPISNIPYTMTYLNSSTGYGTLDPQTINKSEFISFTGITQNTDGTAQLTGVTRGLSRTPGSGGCVASTTLSQSHSGQSVFEFTTNSPCFYSEYAVKSNSQTITGDWQVPAPANPFSIAPKNYVDGKIFGGIGNASETATGTVEIATQLEAASSSTNGSLGRLALPASIATSTCSSFSVLSVLVTSNNGRLDGKCLDSYQRRFTASGSISIGDAVSLSQGTTSLDTVSGSNSSGATSLTYTHQITGINTGLVVYVWDENADGVTSVTYNSVAMTQLTKVSSGGAGEIYEYYIMNPSQGSNSITITRSGSSGNLYGIGVSYKNMGAITTGSTNFSSSAASMIATTTAYDSNFQMIGVAFASGGTLLPATTTGTALNGIVLYPRRQQGTVSIAFDSDFADLVKDRPYLPYVSSSGGAGNLAMITSLIAPAGTSTVVTRTIATDRGSVNGFIGFANSAATTGNSVDVNLGSFINNLTGLTRGAWYYLSNTAGAISSTTPGTFQRRIGTALSATELLLYK